MRDRNERLHPQLPAHASDEFLPDDEGAFVPIDLRRMISILRRHWLLVAGVTLACAGAAFLAGTVRAPVYRATAVIRIHDARTQLSGGLATTSTGEELGGPQVNPLLSLVELLSSRTMAGTVVDTVPVLRVTSRDVSLSLVDAVDAAPDHPADSLALVFLPGGLRLAGEPDSLAVPYGTAIGHDGFRVTLRARPAVSEGTIHLMTRDDAIRNLLGSLRVRPRENTDVVDVQFSGPDPAMAREVADRLVSVFQSANAYSAQSESRSRRQFLESQLKDANAALATARDALAGFRARQRSFSARERFASQQARATALRGRRSTLDEQRQLYQSLLRGLRDSSTVTGPALMALLSSPGLEDKPLIRQLSEQLGRYQSQRDSLTSGPYGSAVTNPDVARLTSLISTTQARLAVAVRSSIDVLDQQIAALDSQRSVAAPAYQQLSANESDESALQEAMLAAGRQVDQLQEQYQAARLSEAVGVGQVEVVDFAGPAETAGLPRSTLAMGGMLLGLLLGCLVAFVVEYLRPTIWRQHDLALAFESPNPIVVPRFAHRRRLAGSHRHARENGSSLVMIKEPRGGGAEALRALRTKLIFSGDWSDLKTLLVTSAVENEGKSTVAANLAIAFAQQGVRTLLIDADMRQPCLHRVFSVMREPGLSAVLDGTAEADDIIQATSVENLFILPAGRVPENPAEALGAEALSLTLDAACRTYEVVILDSPPLLAVSDASIIAATTDGVLMVVRAGRAQRETLNAAREQLVDVRARMVGAVLNDPDGQVTRGGEGYYFYGYHGNGEPAARN